jgi:hypothetical protein
MSCVLSLPSVNDLLQLGLDALFQVASLTAIKQILGSLYDSGLSIFESVKQSKGLPDVRPVDSGSRQVWSSQTRLHGCSIAQGLLQVNHSVGNYG